MVDYCPIPAQNAASDMEWEDDFYEPDPDVSEERQDPKVEEAKRVIKQIFKDDPTSVFYLKQIQVRLERQFFHWVTGFAVRDLIEAGFLQAETVRAGGNANVLVKFVFRPSHRFRRRQIKKACSIIAAYSEPEISRACGKQAEILFLNALMKEGFGFYGQDTATFRDRKWNETDHDLDFIVTRDGITYGCEVKNRLEYIERGELELKLKMCAFLGVCPLFIMRAAAKSYMQLIVEGGGYGWIFASQIFPLGHERLVERMVKELGLPALGSVAIPQGMVDRFLKWHLKLLRA